MIAPPTVPLPRYQPPHGGQPYSYPSPPRRSRRKWPWVVLGVLVLFIIIGVANSPSPPSSTTDLAPTPEQTTQAADPPTPPPVARQPVAPLSVAPPPVARQPVAPQPVTPRPVAPQQTAQTADPPTQQPVAPLQDNGSSGSGAVYYKNCDAAQAAGAAPINRGEPGYRSALDRDNDGTACE